MRHSCSHQHVSSLPNNNASKNDGQKKRKPSQLNTSTCTASLRKRKVQRASYLYNPYGYKRLLPQFAGTFHLFLWNEDSNDYFSVCLDFQLLASICCGYGASVVICNLSQEMINSLYNIQFHFRIENCRKPLKSVECNSLISLYIVNAY